MPPSPPSPSAPERPPRPDGADRGASRELVGGRCPPAAHDHSRLARLWRAVRRTRDELDMRQGLADAVAERFATTIRPREERFTRTVCRVTERLIVHHERTALDGAGRTLLGLWINDNLGSLATHPFAPRERVDALATRWRGHLGAASHPLDAPLASVYMRGTRSADEARPASGGGVAPAARGHGERPSSGAGGDAPQESGAGASRGEAGEDAAVDATAADPARLVARLFRPLARALHPDREQDEARKLDKHRLMSECLRARDEGDVDALLALYVAHVGALPEALAGEEASDILHLLERQLERLRRRLHGLRFGDALRTMLVERYGGGDAAGRERLFAAHEESLDREIERFEALERLLVDGAGLHEALDTRRELELDRLAIDELTGVGRVG